MRGKPLREPCRAKKRRKVGAMPLTDGRGQTFRAAVCAALKNPPTELRPTTSLTDVGGPKHCWPGAANGDQGRRRLPLRRAPGLTAYGPRCLVAKPEWPGPASPRLRPLGMGPLPQAVCRVCYGLLPAGFAFATGRVSARPARVFLSSLPARALSPFRWRRPARAPKGT
jgi:hypothetical protein